jgi:hypothetical protein
MSINFRIYLHHVDDECISFFILIILVKQAKAFFSVWDCFSFEWTRNCKTSCATLSIKPLLFKFATSVRAIAWHTLFWLLRSFLMELTIKSISWVSSLNKTPWIMVNNTHRNITSNFFRELYGSDKVCHVIMTEINLIP